MTAANLVSYSAQIAGLVLACAAIPRVLALRSPGLQYLFWRVLLAVCLLLPIVEPWRIREMTAVAAPAVFAASAVPGRTTPATPDAVPSFAPPPAGGAPGGGCHGRAHRWTAACTDMNARGMRVIYSQQLRRRREPAR